LKKKGRSYLQSAEKKEIESPTFPKEKREKGKEKKISRLGHGAQKREKGLQFLPPDEKTG